MPGYLCVSTSSLLWSQIHNSCMNVHSKTQVNGKWYMALQVPLCWYLLLHLSKSRSSSQSELECNQLCVEKGRIPFKRSVSNLSFVQHHHLLNSKNYVWKVCPFEQLLNRENYRRLHIFTKRGCALPHLLIQCSKSSEITSCRCQALRTKQNKKRKMDILVTMERLLKKRFSRSLKAGKTQKVFSIATPLSPVLPTNINSSVIHCKAALPLLNLKENIIAFSIHQ